MKSLPSALHCSSVIGASPDIDTCLKDIDAMACAQLEEGGSLPSTCKGVLEMNSSSKSFHKEMTFSEVFVPVDDIKQVFQFEAPVTITK